MNVSYLYYRTWWSHLNISVMTSQTFSSSIYILYDKTTEYLVLQGPGPVQLLTNIQRRKKSTLRKKKALEQPGLNKWVNGFWHMERKNLKWWTLLYSQRRRNVVEWLDDPLGGSQCELQPQWDKGRMLGRKDDLCSWEMEDRGARGCCCAPGLRRLCVNPPLSVTEERVGDAAGMSCSGDSGEGAAVNLI